MRAFFDEAGPALKAATVASISAVGGVSHASRLLGIGTAALSKYSSTSGEWANSFIRVDLAAALDRAAGHDFITSTMRGLVDGEKPAGFGQLTALAVLRLDGVLDDVVREVAQAIEDGHADACERQAVRARIVPAMRALAALDALMAGL
ncbi:hypothetical protein [Rhizobium sp. SGZ-381]|uniref:hypothetical protein n=1 Tax=Rhizobium sp. SGZ-381 TaxID=3342800 RepID=UPI00366DB44B